MRPEKDPTVEISIERDGKRRAFVARADGKEVGRALLSYYSKPFPLYEILALEVQNRYRGKGYGSTIMSAIEKHLKKIGRTGVLSETIDHDSPAAGMYERRGWERFSSESGRHTFNLPKRVLKGEVAQFYLRLEDRQRRQHIRFVAALKGDGTKSRD